jgi:putative transposase
MLKRHPHSPAHLFLDGTPYFVTGAIYQKRHLLVDPELKRTLLNIIQENFQTYNWQLHHWVILDNHYHLLGQSLRGEDLTKIFKGIHGGSGSIIREATQGEKPIWWNYWDYCPRNEHQYLTRLNYLLYNPVKHGYIKDLHDYPFSSFHTLFVDMGRDQLAHQFRNYPDYKTLVLHEAKEDDF